jgi:P27 family predicted phage terminase small subunit
MGKRGPKRKPPALRAVAGTDLEPGPPEPPAQDDRPTPPAWLTPLARKEWDRLEQSLWELGCLSEIDQGMFAALCQTWGRYEQAEIDLNAAIAAELSKTPSRKSKTKKPQAHGAVAKTKSGNLILNPLYGVVNSLRRDYQRLASEFGLSPSARSSVGGKGGGKLKDPIAEKYFRNGG